MHWLVSKFLAEEYRKKFLTFYSSNNDFLAYALFTWVIDNLKFKHRRKITITEQSGNDLTDYQVLIELNSSNFDFSHSDGNDIRFYNGEVFLPYWVEKWDGVNQEAKIWVKVPSISANGTISFYMYYGNPVLLSASSPELTFVRVIDGCVLALPMDEGSGDTVYDKSGNDNDGTIYGGATWTDGKFGKALDFNGTDSYVRVPNDGSLDYDNNSEITVVAWAKIEGNTDDHQIILYHMTSYKGYWFYLKYDEKQWRFLLTDLDVYLFSSFYDPDPYNKWIHLVGTYANNTTELYVNGEKKDEDTKSLSDFSVTSDVFVGSKKGDENFFNGIIDEVLIFYRVLSEEEIQDLYNYYGYNTENYPGKTLVRKRVNPEPSVSVGAEETP